MEDLGAAHAANGPLPGANGRDQSQVFLKRGDVKARAEHLYAGAVEHDAHAQIAARAAKKIDADRDKFSGFDAGTTRSQA